MRDGVQLCLNDVRESQGAFRTIRFRLGSLDGQGDLLQALGNVAAPGLDLGASYTCPGSNTSGCNLPGRCNGLPDHTRPALLFADIVPMLAHDATHHLWQENEATTRTLLNTDQDECAVHLDPGVGSPRSMPNTERRTSYEVSTSIFIAFLRRIATIS